jgi:hypothetical protein
MRDRTEQPQMYVQVTPLDRPLPPGEGRGEGLCHSGSEANHRQRHQVLTQAFHKMSARRFT